MRCHLVVADLRLRRVVSRLGLVVCRCGRRVVGCRGRGRSITRKRLHYSKTVVVVNQLVRDRP